MGTSLNFDEDAFDDILSLSSPVGSAAGTSGASSRTSPSSGGGSGRSTSGAPGPLCSTIFVGPQNHAGLCLGLIGAGAKFCTRLEDDCHSKAHRSKKFEADGTSYYIPSGDKSALCKPSVKMSAITDPAMLHDVQESERPRVEWLELFYKINSARPAEPVSDFKTPSSTTSDNRRDAAPTPSAITSMRIGKWDPEFDDTSGLDSSFLQTLKEMHVVLSEVVAYIPGLYRDIESQANMATAEYASLAHKFEKLWGVIGSTDDTQFSNEQTILSLLDDVVEQQSSAPTEDALNAVRQVAEDARSTADGLIVQTTALADRNKRICIFLQRLKERVVSLRDTELTSIEQRLSTAERILRTGRAGVPASDSDDEVLSLDDGSAALSPSGEGHFTTVLSDLRNLKLDLARVENRVKGRGVNIPELKLAWDCKEDFIDWVKVEVPNCHFGDFVDLVSIFSFMYMDYVEEDKGNDDRYGAMKNKFESTADSKVANAHLNIIPKFLAKGGGKDASPFLPGLTTLKQWEGVDSLSGQAQSNSEFHACRRDRDRGEHHLRPPPRLQGEQISHIFAQLYG